MMQMIGNLALMMIVCVGCTQKPSNKLTIAAAANTQFTIKEIIDSFQQQSGMECEIIIGSSGKLTAQIIEGAPYDVFISADMKYPQELYNKGLTIHDPLEYAYGKLVLWTANEEMTLSIKLLSNDSIEHIALANPKTAPYGVAGIEALAFYGITDAVSDKLVYGESISQANQFIMSGSAQIGFTAKSVVLSSGVAGKGTWLEVDSAAYQPIAQGAVVIGRSVEKGIHAKEFVDFLFSEKGKEILTNFGYSVSR